MNCSVVVPTSVSAESDSSSHLSISNHANKTENATLQLDQALGSVKPTETYLIGKTVEPGRNWFGTVSGEVSGFWALGGC
jgi:hypothetical protein